MDFQIIPNLEAWRMVKDERIGQTKHKKLTRVNLLVAKAGGHRNKKSLKRKYDI